MKETDHLDRERYVRDSMRGLSRQLLAVHAGIVVCAQALSYQNVDRDADVASVLTNLVAGRLSEQIERLTDLRAVLRNPPAGTARADGD